MKKIIALALTLVMVLALVPVFTYAAPEGTGIDSLDKITDLAGTYYLTKDITVETTLAGEFTGKFDGNGKKVTVKAPMFAKTNGATVQNFTVAGTLDNTNGINVGDYNFVAAVAVVANGKSVFKNIVCDVDFTATNDKGRYGAIAATSEKGHELLFENCTNNGDVTADLSGSNYAGGVYGWSAQLGNSVFKNCVNTGKVTVQGYCGGVVCRLGTKGAGGSVTFENCKNTGDVTSTASYCGGIFGYSETLTCVSYSVNTGKITAAKSSTGGIGGNIGNANREGENVFKFNVNTGDVTNGADGNTGGILGYLYGTGTFAAVLEGNVNTGTITSKGYVSQLLAYSNSNLTKIVNNVAAGKVVGDDPNTAVVIGLSGADITKYTIKGNFYAENDGTKTFSYADSDSNAKNRLTLEAKPADSMVTTTAAQFASGEVTVALNTALGSKVFGQTLGTDKVPSLDASAKEVIKNADGTYGNPKPVTPTPTGDIAASVAVVAFVALFGAAYVSKKVR